MTRRDLGLTLLGPAAAMVARPEAAQAARAKSYSSEHPDMLVQYLAGKLNKTARQWDEVRARIRTRDQMIERNRYVRESMIKMIHGLPERTPLTPVTVASFERKGYRVENVMFQSRPNFWVPGNLYIPLGPGPFPAIISPCGHYADGRVNPEFQSAYLNLVLAGFVVFGYDPIGQGERRQYWNPATNETEVGGPTTEHSMVGQILLMMGEDLTHHRVWDGMRAIDYLLTRKEVDPERIGCAGHSGGGTLTRFIAAIDERVKAAVINEGGTANRWPVDIAPESRLGPSDVEQNLFPGAKLGVDHVDMQAAIAPRPLLCLIEDFFPKFDEAVGKIKQRYELLGAAGKFDAQEATDPHAWTPKLRIAVTQFFSRWFYNKPGPTTEPEYEIESGGRLFSTPKASIRYSRQGETIYGLISKKVASLPPQSGLTREKLRGLLRLPAYRGDLGIRELVTTERKGYRIDKLEFLSEPGIHIPVWVFVPPVPDASKPPLLWVDERGKEAQGGEFGRLEKLTREGRTIVSIDVRGVGGTRIAHAAPGSRPDPYDQLFDPETACAYMAWYLDESLLGMRVFDVMRALDFVAARGLGDKVEAAGRGVGAIWALLAAALDDRIASLTGERMLASYKSIAESDRYLFGAGMMIKDGLLHGDLPHIAALAAPRPVRLIETVDQMRRLLPSEDAAKLYAVAPNVSIG